MSNPFTLRTAARYWSRYQNSNNAVEKTTFAASTAPQGKHCEGSNLLKFVPYGTTADGAKALFTYLTSYTRTGTRDDDTIWIPSFICKLKWTWTGSGNVAGIAAKQVTNTSYFPDKVELIDGDTSIRLITDTSLNVASVTVDLEGATYFEIGFSDDTLTGPDDWNALYGLF